MKNKNCSHELSEFQILFTTLRLSIVNYDFQYCSKIFKVIKNSRSSSTSWLKTPEEPLFIQFWVSQCIVITSIVCIYFRPESLLGLSEWKSVQNFVLKVYIVITSKVFADFCFESPISIDFQSEILALLRPKSAKTFHESLQILSLRKSARTFRIFFPDFLCRLSR